VRNGSNCSAAIFRIGLDSWLQRAPPGDAKGIDGLEPPVRELTYHPVRDIA